MGRGGRREGAGRKPALPEEKKVTFTAKVMPETREMLRTMTSGGRGIGRIIDEAVRDYFENHK